MNAREAIAEAIRYGVRAYASDKSLFVIERLRALGFVILSRSEVEAIRDKALEEAAQVAEPTPAYGDPVEISVGLGPVGERIASAIRALKDSQPQTERQAE